MTITTKFHVHDSVYFMHDNQVHSAQIDYVYTRSYWGGCNYVTDVSYEINGHAKVGKLPEARVFASKEELLASL